MSHPKNTTEPLPSQEAVRRGSLMTTVAHGFHIQGRLSFCTTVSGLQCIDAINFASAILQSASRVCGALIDAENDPAGLHAVLILVDQAKALVDSAVPGIEQAEDFAVVGELPINGGAEASV